MTAPRSRRRWSTALPDWRCYLCGRSAADIGAHPLPVRQQAHLLPNRLTGQIPRYKGVKNALREVEWNALLDALGPTLQAELSCSDDIRSTAISHYYELCGECHEEILSEPVYLPSVMNILRKYFTGASRVQKLTVLARILKLGAESIDRDGAAQARGAGA